MRESTVQANNKSLRLVVYCTVCSMYIPNNVSEVENGIGHIMHVTT